MDIRPVRHTTLIEIRLYGEDPRECAELANAVAKIYMDYLLAARKESLARRAVTPQGIVPEMLDQAKAPLRPVHPNKPLDIFLGFWGALWLGVAAGILVVCVSLKFEKKEIALTGSEWVTAQNGLGAALRDQARASQGVEALRLLDEAAAAYRTVLDAGTRDRFPQGWAMAQNNLGVLLRDRAEWSAPDAALSLLKESVNAHRSALEVYVRNKYPRYWATTQNNLSIALRDQAKRTPGSEGISLMNEAVAVSRAALES